MRKGSQKLTDGELDGLPFRAIKGMSAVRWGGLEHR